VGGRAGGRNRGVSFGLLLLPECCPVSHVELEGKSYDEIQRRRRNQISIRTSCK
jgi:hypothetical protein